MPCRNHLIANWHLFKTLQNRAVAARERYSCIKHFAGMSLEAADTVPVMGKGSRLLHTCCDEFRERLLLISTRVIDY